MTSENNALVLTGVVLLAQPIGEFDKRLVILTRERGKITVFAHGARRQTSPFLAVSNPFVFGSFTVFEGRNAYTLASASAAAYFTELAGSQPGVYYGFYFLELAGYYGQEGIESEGMVNLIYVALRAILRKEIPLPLTRRIYECRMMAENGDFALPEEEESIDGSALYALKFTVSCRIPETFSFSLSEKAERDFAGVVEKNFKRCIDRKFKSLDVLEKISGM